MSEQQLLDCSSSFGNNGCNGGVMTNAFEYLMTKGICSESNYPYLATSTEKCQECVNPVVGTKLSGCSYFSSQNSQNDIIYQLSKQPISVAIQANSPKLQHYKSGVFNDEECYTGNLDHGVLLVAYDNDSIL